MPVQIAPVASSTIVVAVNVGKTSALFSVTDAARHQLVGPSEFAMNRSGLTAAAARAVAAVHRRGGSRSPWRPPVTITVRCSITGRPSGWEVLEINPAHIAEQRRVQGRRRVKTDVIDLEAIAELVLAGHGYPLGERDVVIGELRAWAGHRSRRVATRSATKNQLLGQLDRAFPGLTLALPDVLATRIGRLVAAEFSDPSRLAALGVNRLINWQQPAICSCGARSLSVWSPRHATRCPPKMRTHRQRRQAEHQRLGARSDRPGRPVAVHTLSMIAEFEADLARAETRESMAVARAKGWLRGKQPKLSPRQEAHLVELYRAGHTIGELEELFPVTRSTIYRAVARAGGHERPGRPHTAQRDDRSRRAHDARRLPRFDDRQHGRRDKHRFPR